MYYEYYVMVTMVTIVTMVTMVTMVCVCVGVRTGTRALIFATLTCIVLVLTL